jgi:hypothetical protein
MFDLPLPSSQRSILKRRLCQLLLGQRRANLCELSKDLLTAAECLFRQRDGILYTLQRQTINGIVIFASDSHALEQCAGSRWCKLKWSSAV